MTEITKVLARLRGAIGSERIVRIESRTASESVNGFVVDVGAKWVLLARTMDGGFFDGHAALRLSDIRRIRWDRSFESRSAQTRPEWPPTAPVRRERIDLDSTRGLLRTILEPATLVAIETRPDRSLMWVGLPNELIRNRFYLWEIGPDATWQSEPLGYRIDRTVMVAIDSHYLRGLEAVAAVRPPGAVSKTWPAA
jgi:hypothetical protein